MRMISIFKRALFSLFLTFTITISVAQNNSKDVTFLTGKFNYRNHSSFVKVPIRYTQNEVYLQKETYQAFLKMRKAALKDGVELSIISGTRSFYEQKDKWETKWWAREFSKIKDPDQKVTRLLRWWSMPGTSRHHWGTDVDLNSMKLKYYTTAEGKKTYNWLAKNASEFGFHQAFTPNRKTGYQEEKWHWTYSPLSRLYLKQYLAKVKYSDIKGFKGSERAQGLGVIKKWVENVNPLCK